MTGYSIDEVSKMSGITTRSVRNYLRKYRQLFELRRGPYNSLLFHDGDVETLLQIRTLLREGLKSEDISTRIQEERRKPTMRVTRSDSPVAVAQIDPQALTTFFGRTEALLVQLCEDNVRMRQRMDSLETEVRHSLPSHSSLREVPLLEGPPRESANNDSVHFNLPYFLVAAKDNALAVGRAVFYTLFKRPARGAFGYSELPTQQQPNRPAVQEEKENEEASFANHEEDSAQSTASSHQA